jgi:hypothetical protein
MSWIFKTIFEDSGRFYISIEFLMQGQMLSSGCLDDLEPWAHVSIHFYSGKLFGFPMLYLYCFRSTNLKVKGLLVCDRCEPSTLKSRHDVARECGRLPCSHILITWSVCFVEVLIPIRFIYALLRFQKTPRSKGCVWSDECGGMKRNKIPCSSGMVCTLSVLWQMIHLKAKLLPQCNHS